MIRAAVDRDGGLARRRFGRVHLARGFECACDLDTEVAQDRRAQQCRVMIQKNVCLSVHRLGWLRMNGQTLARAGPHAEPAAPGATSRRTTANLRG
jgi:hypothetical protein